MNKLNSILAVALLAITFTSCKKDEEPIIVAPPSDGSTLTLEGKTAVSPYANTVYADLSTDKQTAIDRKSWNIAFTSDSKFKVLLNAAYQSTAVATSKTDINTVTLADPGTTVNLNHDIMDTKTVSLVDYWDGDITKTAFAEEISATDGNNKVYLLSFEGNKENDKWFKIKVTRSGSGYKIQYARLGETTIKTLDVTKDSNFNLRFVSLENNKIVNVEPEKDKWDISWGYSTYNSGLGSPYWVQDLIMLNNFAGVQAAEVLTTSFTYAAFTEANIAGLTFSGTRDAIGTKWRSTQPATGAKTDRFYVIKDASGNVYKLKFVSMGVGSDGGERGKPVIEYKLVKKG
ncbi:MAG: HmuY family protein [Bacteroidota bacterium]